MENTEWFCVVGQIWALNWIRVVFNINRVSVLWCVVQKYWPLAANSGWRPEPCPCRSCCRRSCRCSCCYRSFHSCCRSCHGYHLSGDTGDRKKDTKCWWCIFHGGYQHWGWGRTGVRIKPTCPPGWPLFPPRFMLPPPPLFMFPLCIGPPLFMCPPLGPMLPLIGPPLGDPPRLGMGPPPRL